MRRFVCALALCALVFAGLTPAAGAEEPFDLSPYLLDAPSSLFSIVMLPDGGMLQHGSGICPTDASWMQSQTQLVRRDAAGNTVWTYDVKYYPATEQGASKIMPLADGRYAQRCYVTDGTGVLTFFDADKGLLGETDAFDLVRLWPLSDGFIATETTGGSALWLQWFDLNGDTVTTRDYPREPGLAWWTQEILEMDDGLLLMGGTEDMPSYLSLTKLDSGKEIAWEAQYAWPSGSPLTMARAEDGGAFVYGDLQGGTPGELESYAVRVDREGRALWARRVDMPYTYLDPYPYEGGFRAVINTPDAVGLATVDGDGELTGMDWRSVAGNAQGFKNLAVNNFALDKDGAPVLCGYVTNEEGFDSMRAIAVPFDALPKAEGKDNK